MSACALGWHKASIYGAYNFLLPTFLKVTDIDGGP